MKKIINLLLALLLLSAIFSCGTSPKGEPTPIPGPTNQPTPPPPPPPQIIEHKMSDFGGSLPDWVTMTASEVEALPEYEGMYVFIEDHSGESREGIEMWARQFSAASALSGFIKTKVKSKFVGAAAGDQNFVETYMEQVVKSVSEGEFSGLREEEKFWIRKRYFDQDGNVDHEEYRYLFLFTIPKKELSDAIKRAYDGATPATEEEKSAKDRVLEAWGDDLEEAGK